MNVIVGRKELRAEGPVSRVSRSSVSSKDMGEVFSPHYEFWNEGLEAVVPKLMSSRMVDRKRI
jgi:hypothetical protein